MLFYVFALSFIVIRAEVPQPKSVILVDKPVIHITKGKVISGKFAVSNTNHLV